MTYSKRYQTRNKYKAVKQTYKGRSYHSKLEAGFAATLDALLQAKKIKEIIPQFKIELYVNKHKICNYYMDFKVIHNDDSVEFIEVKGFETALWRLKWKLTQALLEEIEPNKKLTLIKG